MNAGNRLNEDAGDFIAVEQHVVGPFQARGKATFGGQNVGDGEGGEEGEVPSIGERERGAQDDRQQDVPAGGGVPGAPTASTPLSLELGGDAGAVRGGVGSIDRPSAGEVVGGAALGEVTGGRGEPSCMAPERPTPSLPRREGVGSGPHPRPLPKTNISLTM